MPNSIFFYRIARFCYLKNIPFIPKILQLIIFLMYNCKIPASTEIGKGSFLVCKGIGVSIIDNTKIGINCRIGIGVKIVGKSPYVNVPQIGDNVYIGPGAVIAGPVIIEDNVIIAPNAVVTKSVRSGMIVGGVPARVIGDTSKLNYNLLDVTASVKGHAEYM